MRRAWKDVLSSVLAAAGGVVVFAKLESYHWWLIGSWKGAVGVLAVLGLTMALTNVGELRKFTDAPSVLETYLWLLSAIAVAGSLLSTTTKPEFVTCAIAVGVAWLAQTTRHAWRATHHHGTHYLPVH